MDSPVQAKIPTFIPGLVLDLSGEGLLLRVRKPLARGSAYMLKLALPWGEVEVRATIRHCRLAGFETDEMGDRVRSYEVGLEFEGKAPDLLAGKGAAVGLSATLEGDGDAGP